MQFGTMFYYSLINLGLGDLFPLNPPEFLFCLLSMICSSFVFSHIFGEIGSLFQQMNQKLIEQQEKQDIMNELMKSFEFTESLKREVRLYMNKI